MIHLLIFIDEKNKNIFIIFHCVAEFQILAFMFIEGYG